MTIFSSINPNLPETKKIKARQLILQQLRASGPNPLDLNSPLFTPLLFDPNSVGQKNCENLVGQVSLPLGVAGPLSATLVTNHQNTKLDGLLIPLATTEGALVASINRGCKLLDTLENAKVTIKNIGMTRSPVFHCQTQAKAKGLVHWIQDHLPTLGKIGESTSHHLIYKNYQIFQRDRLVFARFAFDTSEAMGMNMVTIAASAISHFILKNNPGITCPALSSNVCTDKKTSALNRRLGRGRWVTVTCSIPSALLSSILKTTPTDLLATYHAKIVVGSRLAGLAGRNMQIANVAAAILTATGQDIAHTVDISQGSLTLRPNSSGIFAKLSLPTVPVGILGGGTYLKAQTAARNLIIGGSLTSDILAATIALAALAGELSGLAALASDTLASTHERLGR